MNVQYEYRIWLESRLQSRSEEKGSGRYLFRQVWICVVLLSIFNVLFSLNANAADSASLPFSQRHERDSLHALLERSDLTERQRVEVLLDLGNIYIFSSVDTAGYYYNSARILVEHLEDSRFKMTIYSRIAYFLDNQMRFDEALEYLYKAQAFATRENNDSVQAEVYYFMGHIYKRQSHTELAFESYSRALQYSTRAGFIEMLPMAHNLLAEVALEQQKFPLAIAHINDAFQSIDNAKGRWREKRLSAQYAAAFAFELLGGVHLAQYAMPTTMNHHIDSAIEAYHRCLAIAGENTRRARVYGTLAVCHATLRQRDSARYYAQEALRLSLTVNNRVVILATYKHLMRTYELLGVPDTAYYFSQQAFALRDTLYRRQVLEKISYLNTVQERERQTYEEQRQRTVEYALMTALVMSLVVVGFLINRYRLKQRSENHIRKQHLLLEQQNERLATLNNEKNDLLGVVSHDLKNPIAAIRGLTDLLHNGFIPEAQIPSVTGQLMTIADRMLELVNNLLDLNRLESGAIELHPVAVDIVPMLEAALHQYDVPTEAKHLSMTLETSNTAATVLADEQALMQVFDNLLSNAVKYTPHGKRVIVRVVGGNTQPGKRTESGQVQKENNENEKDKSENNENPATKSYIRVEVENEGEGISKEDMKKLFGKFARLSARPTGGEHSTGLGLSIVKKMVEVMNGRVWCESEVGKGATFIVELPNA